MHVTNGRVFRTLIALLVVGACGQARPVTPPPTPTPPPPEREEPEPERPLKLGVIVPRSGASDLSAYASLIQEGIELALAQYAASGGGREVELVVKDDSGRVAAASRAAADLEAEGAVAIIGPLLPNALDAAAAARPSDLLIVSPTASEPPRQGGDHAFSLNADDTRGAVALAAWAVSAGFTQLGVLYATTPQDAAEARAFIEEARRRNAQVVAEIPFDPGTTTFADPIQRLIAAGVKAVFVPASERDVRQLAPQFAYFGMTDVQILGTEAWVSEQVLRTVPAPALEGVVAATPLPESGEDTGWLDFVQLYERERRRTLDSPYPALGYDAAMLVLREIGRGRTERSALAEAVASVRDYRGATGVLSLEPGRVSRQPFLVRIRAGQPQPLPAAGG